ncbi:MAG: CRISPR-associated endonuclease Cas1 [Candidatus Sulfotelmatobacter sp.]|jgi:CRISPR-associated endonuclease Cas1
MAAGKTVYQPAQFLNSVPRHGVLTVSGYIQIRVDKGHLIVEDQLGFERSCHRLPRIGHRLKRLVIVGSKGFVTLPALQWLKDQDASLVFLERNGKVLCVTGPVASSDAKLRRAQALAMSNGVGLETCRTLIEAKLQGQERVLRERLNCQPAAAAVARFRNNLGSVESFDAIRNLEANAAGSYFREWREFPVAWPKADLQKIPRHWRFVGSRQSPLTGGPRLAVTPAHAILNYCFALLEAETRLAISSLGLDPGLGLGLHTDTADRSSMAFDILEPVRPEVERWLLSWIASEPLRRADFFETATGNCRLMAPMCTKLSATAPAWRKLVAPWAEYVVRTLWAGTKSGRARNSVPPTRLTQQRRTEAKGKIWIAAVEPPKADHLCRGCGKTITNGRIHCAKCAVSASTVRLIDAARSGRVAGHTPEALAKEAQTQRQHAQARSAWTPASQPAWLTVQVYLQKIQPSLARMSSSAIASRMGVSRWYAGRIRQGYRPHPRHWEALAELVGVSEDV